MFEMSSGSSDAARFCEHGSHNTREDGAMTSMSQELPVDGRRARRERGRLAVTDAMIDLVLEGHAPPSAELVASRAGVSLASLFRYFENLDQLRRATIARYLDRFAELFEVPDEGHGTLDERLARFAGSRVRLYEVTGPMARLARRQAATVPDLDDTLHRFRATQVEQIRRHFATELDLLPAGRRDDLVAMISTITSFESWAQLRDDHARTPARTRRLWVRTLGGLLRDPAT
jgi:AcrR family transcriptional regulator